MATLHRLTPTIWVAGQINAADMAEAKALGIVRIVNNRPDGEEYGQPSAEAMAETAHAQGLDYVHAPSFGMPGPAVVDVVEAAIADGAPVLLHCKSGMRSTVAWALAASRQGIARDDIVAAAAGAGYDLSSLPLRP